jgi:hypothetical protein
MELPKAITDYIYRLDECTLNRVLGSRLGEAGDYLREDGCRCLVGAVRDYRTMGDMRADSERRDAAAEWFVGCRFDHMCRAYGDAAVGGAIRDYITELRARRTLAMPQLQAVG